MEKKPVSETLKGVEDYVLTFSGATKNASGAYEMKGDLTKQRADRRNAFRYDAF